VLLNTLDGVLYQHTHVLILWELKGSFDHVSMEMLFPVLFSSLFISGGTEDALGDMSYDVCTLQ